MTKEELLEKAKLLPLTPGVYLMRNRAGTVIYVGKVGSFSIEKLTSEEFCTRLQKYFENE